MLKARHFFALFRMKRFLITTEDERSWKFEQPVLFLGDWCRLYRRRHIWTPMDASVARPYGLESDLKNRNLEYVQCLIDQLLNELAIALNRIHGTVHDSRYWNIVIGHWLRRYVAVVFNRYHALQQALNENEVSGSIVFEAPEYVLATQDSISLVWAIGDPVWNHVLYSRALNFLGAEQTQSVSRILEGVGKYGYVSPTVFDRAMSSRQRLKQTINRILSAFSRKNDAFIVNSHLPLFEEACLQISLGQMPQRWRSPTLRMAQFDQGFRQGLCIETEEFTGFELFVRRQLRDMIPICYLEGYASLKEQVNTLPWPNEPQFIFTSNNFEFDETFMLWTAAKVEKGTPYYTGQHGNNYGTYRGLQKLPELVTSDKFFTWGWTDDDPKNVPAFVFNIAGRKPRKKNAKDGLLLVEHVVPPRQEPEDSYFLFSEYQEDQFLFVEALPKRLQPLVTVRLARGSEKFSWSDRLRWKDRSKDVQIDSGSVGIHRLIADSRLVVYSYDSTGLLESLALNMPTMCFWRGGLDHLLPVAKPYYELLRDVGIIMDTPQQAASKVTEHWDQIGKWWENDALQAARREFCEQYAKTVKTPVRTLKRLLTAHSLVASSR